MIKLAESNFARRFIGVQGRESPIFVNFAATEAPKFDESAARPCCNVMLLGCCDSHAYNFARRVDVGSACRSYVHTPID